MGNVRAREASASATSSTGKPVRKLGSLSAPEAHVSNVVSGKQAVEMLRMGKFDLVAIGHDVSDMTPWQLARKVRLACPWQKWAYVARDVDHEDEILARSLGAVAIFEGSDCFGQVIETASRIRKKNPAAFVAGMAMGMSTFHGL
jgi:CheY-like chemotaxis protein